MRTLGLLGGMSWESTATYYKLLNEGAKARCGGLHSASLVMRSYDFAEIAAQQAAGAWERLAARLADDAARLENYGAEGLVLCTNTMHRLYDHIAQAVTVPVLHIGDATAEAIRRAGRQRPILLGTRFTMEGEFYRKRLRDLHGIETLVPAPADMQIVHEIIYGELCRGCIEPSSRKAYVDIIERLRKQGADGVILGCTEIGLLIGPQDVDLPLFDTTSIHAEAALDFACAGSPD